MKDLSRERIAAMRRNASDPDYQNESVDGPPCVPVLVTELLALLDMASRAVSEETVRLSAKYRASRVGTAEEHTQARGDFVIAAERDLRPSAEALARSAGEGLLRSLGLDKETR